MQRREFITLLGGTAAASGLARAARAQQPKPVVGYLGSASPDVWGGRVRAFLQGLNETGFADGRDVIVEYRWAEDQYDRLPMLAADLVRRGVSVIVAPGSAPAALAAKAATTMIPIVFETGADPVELGLVASMSRPGANLTGVTALAFQLGPKRLEVLHEVVPSVRILAALVNPDLGRAAETQTRDLQTAASKMGLELQILQTRTDRDFDAAFATLLERRAGGLVIIPDVLLNGRREQLAALALRHAVPAIFQSREFAAAGGLLSYGAIIGESHRLAGVYTGRILKGEKPGDLPVQQASKVELIVNLKAAKSLGVTVPLSLLGRADEVIE
jgi:putative ABC transport system substrate-binding protein